MVISASDAFAAANGTFLASHTGNSGHGWMKYAGQNDLEIVFNKVFSLYGATTPGRHKNSCVPSSPEYVVLAEIGRVADVASASASLLARCGNDHYGYEAEINNSGSVTLYRWTGTGARSVLGSYGISFGVGTSVEVALAVFDNEKAVFVNGIKRIVSADNTTAAAGQAGIDVCNEGFSISSFRLEEQALVSPAFDTLADIVSLRKIFLADTCANIGQTMALLFDTRADLTPRPPYFHRAGVFLAFSRAPLRPERRRDLLQATAASAAGVPFAFDPFAAERPLVLAWTGITAAEAAALEAFFFAVVGGMRETFIYCDIAGVSRTVRFAVPELAIEERAPGRYAVTCQLLEVPA